MLDGILAADSDLKKIHRLIQLLDREFLVPWFQNGPLNKDRSQTGPMKNLKLPGIA
jgi:hypothetical protein